MNTDEIVQLARQRALKKGRRVWYADHKELQNVAAVAILEAQRTFDPSIGVPEAAYCGIAAERAVGSFLLAQSSPVSASRGKHAFELARARRVEPGDELIDPSALEDAYGALELAERIHYRLVALDESPNGVALRVLLDGAKPAKEAERTGMDVSEVYKWTRALRCRIGADRRLWELQTEFRRSFE